jgi:2-polyprenyl-3-methyl-5-hydroxy-6-metoxy-1,4-benzoquinol methylase
VKTDYAAHDARYQQLRTQGAVGWDTEEVYLEREAELAWARASLEAPGTRLLEPGCGAGNAAATFVEWGFTVTGIDISPTAIEWATERATIVDHRDYWDLREMFASSVPWGLRLLHAVRRSLA